MHEEKVQKEFVDCFIMSILFRSPFFTSLLNQGNYFFTAIFAVESFVKLVAMSPRFFFVVSTMIIHIIFSQLRVPEFSKNILIVAKQLAKLHLSQIA